MASVSLRSLVGRVRLTCRKTTRLSSKSLNVACHQQTILHTLSKSSSVTPCFVQQARLLSLNTPANQQNKELNETSTSDKSTSSSSASGTSNINDTRQSSVSRDPPDSQSEAPAKVEEEPEGSIGIFKRFRNAYKEHGKVLIGVHCVTSSVWISVFYYAAARSVMVRGFWTDCCG